MWKWVVVFLHDLVEPSEVYAKVEGTILFANNEDRSSMSRGRGMDETIG